MREILPCGLRQHVRLGVAGLKASGSFCNFSLLQSSPNKTRQECLDLQERQAEPIHASDIIIHGSIRPLVIDFHAASLEYNGSDLHLFTPSQRS
jgi:hypothetical protein